MNERKHANSTIILARFSASYRGPDAEYRDAVCLGMAYGHLFRAMEILYDREQAALRMLHRQERANDELRALLVFQGRQLDQAREQLRDVEHGALSR